jgi:hypothetical protein
LKEKLRWVRAWTAKRSKKGNIYVQSEFLQ